MLFTFYVLSKTNDSFNLIDFKSSNHERHILCGKKVLLMMTIPITRKSNNDSANMKLNGTPTKLIFKKDKIHEGDDLLISTTKDILLLLL